MLVVLPAPPPGALIWVNTRAEVSFRDRAFDAPNGPDGRIGTHCPVETLPLTRRASPRDADKVAFAVEPPVPVGTALEQAHARARQDEDQQREWRMVPRGGIEPPTP
jgi:hypothetical protein